MRRIEQIEAVLYTENNVLSSGLNQSIGSSWGLVLGQQFWGQYIIHDSLSRCEQVRPYLLLNLALHFPF